MRVSDEAIQALENPDPADPGRYWSGLYYRQR
jgi:hypothetical protein